MTMTPSPQPSPQGERENRGTQAKACGYPSVSFILHLIMSSIICRMTEEIRAIEVAPTHAIVIAEFEIPKSIDPEASSGPASE